MAQTQEPPPPVVYELAFPELPYTSRWVEVDGVKLHYFDEGDPAADPILLLHGIPAWSYLWRDVIPQLAPHRRVIALDFPGFGRSDDLERYTVDQHVSYLEGFVEALGLDDLTLVVHDLGSVAGLSFAAHHEAQVRALVLTEAALPPLFPIDFGNLAAYGAAGELWQLLITPGLAESAVLDQNLFVEELLPQMVFRPLSDEEIDAYRAPFPTPRDRLAILGSSPGQIPLYGVEPAAFNGVIEEYTAWLTETPTPTLLLYVTPGVLGTEASVRWARDNLKNLTTVHLGDGAHFVQEDHPEAIGQEIVHWLSRTAEHR